jgi:hypothetical protein
MIKRLKNKGGFSDKKVENVQLFRRGDIVRYHHKLSNVAYA